MSKRMQEKDKARARKRAQKAARMKTPGAKSSYQVKQGDKRGGGRVNPDWMWWFSRSEP